jgi:hypothetical protein
MDHCLRTIKVLFLFSLVVFAGKVYSDPLRPDQKIRDSKNQILKSKDLALDYVKWPRASIYELGVQFSNNRIDGFQIQNNTKGTLVSETNMAAAIQYYNWIKRTYDVSVGLHLESIHMLDEKNAIPIDNSQVLSIGFNLMLRYLVYENLYLKAILADDSKIFYSSNSTLSGYELQTPMIPSLGGGASVMFAEIKKIKFGIEGLARLYQASAAGRYQIESGTGYEVKLFSMWPRQTQQIISELYYNGRTQNTSIIRTEEQKVGFGMKYQF